MACDIDSGLNVKDPPGGTCRRWRRVLTCRAPACLPGLCLVALIVSLRSLDRGSHWLRIAARSSRDPSLAGGANEGLEGGRGLALARHAEVPRRVADVVPDDSGEPG